MGGSGSSGRISRAGLAGGVVVVAGIGWLVLALVSRSWFSAALAVIFVAASAVGFRSRPLELAFSVGHDEVHRVVFRFNKFWGNLSITVDERPVVRDVRMFSVRLTKTYRFSVGTNELHEVRIEKDRKALLAGGRSQPVRAFVDDVLIAKGVA